MTLNELYEKRSDFFIKESSQTKFGIYIVAAIGLGLLAWGFSLDASRAWGAVLTSNLFFFFLSLGGVIFGGIQDVIGALWARPIKRIHESFGSFFVPSSAVFIVFLLCIKFDLLGADQVYKWVANPAMLDHFPGKNVWLTENFFIIRNIATLVVMALLVAWSRKQNSLADSSFLSGKLKEAEELGKLGKDRLRFWSGPILFAHGVLFTFIVTDITMSLSPLWFSTLWGGWSFAVLMQSLLAMILVVLFVFKRTTIGSLFTQAHFHDVGKMLHGFTAFWGYLTFAHILTYWYGNVPEETEYFIHRLHQPWLGLMIAVGFMAFVIPFFVLIPKASKWTGWVIVPLSLVVLFAQWLVHFLVVQPEVVSSTKLGFPVSEIGAFLFLASLFVWSVYSYGRKNLMVSLPDPLLKRYMDEKAHH